MIRTIISTALFILFNNLAFSLYAETKFLMLLPLSGSYSFVGQDARQGIEIALSEIEKPLNAELIYADSQADPKISISEFNRALDLHNIFGAFAFRGPVGMTVNPISYSKQIPLLGGVANKTFTEENPYAYQLWADSEAEAEFLISSIQKLKSSSLAIITAEDDYPMAVSKEVKILAGKSNIQIKSSHDLAPSETDFRTLALNLAQSKPDIIFANLGISQFSPFIKQLRQQKVNSKIVCNFWVTKQEVLSSLGQQAEGLFSIEVSTDYPKLNLDLKEKFNSSASSVTVSAYIATHMLNQALSLIKDDKIDKHSFFTALTKLENIETKNGSFPVSNRKVFFPLSLKIIRDSKSVLYTE